MIATHEVTDLVEETAEVLGVSMPTVILDTRLARAFLFNRLGSGYAS